MFTKILRIKYICMTVILLGNSVIYSMHKNSSKNNVKSPNVAANKPPLHTPKKIFRFVKAQQISKVENKQSPKQHEPRKLSTKQIEEMSMSVLKQQLAAQRRMHQESKNKIVRLRRIQTQLARRMEAIDLKSKDSR